MYFYFVVKIKAFLKYLLSMYYVLSTKLETKKGNYIFFLLECTVLLGKLYVHITPSLGTAICCRCGPKE